jgi:hypothetical protein
MRFHRLTSRAEVIGPTIPTARTRPKAWYTMSRPIQPRGIVTIMTRAHKAAATLTLVFQRTVPIATSRAHDRGQDRGPSGSWREEA